MTLSGSVGGSTPQKDTRIIIITFRLTLRGMCGNDNFPGECVVELPRSVT